MHRLIVVMLLAAGSAAAQVQPPDPVAVLPGAGRAVSLEAYRMRRARVVERARGVVLAPAAARRDAERDVLQDSDFRQDDYFFYLTGLETPGAWVLLAPGNGTIETTLFLPPANPRAVRWMGVQLAPGPEAERLSGISPVLALSQDRLREAVSDALARTGGPLLSTQPEAAAGLVPEGEVRDLRPLLDSLRLVKDELGLAALRRAAEITAAGVREGMEATRPGMFEYQLEAVIEYGFRSRGADRLGFPSIVGSGPNSVVLHYDVNTRRMESGDLVVVDVGAEFAQHTADVTRTFPVSGRFTARQRAIYEIVLGTQEAVIAAIRPGVTLRDLGEVARRYLEEHGDGHCGPRGCVPYFIHGVSHWLGMRVHDVGDWTTPLAPGMVLTVEPGIYLPEEDLGIRIEDDVLVTESGAEVLSTGAPKTTDDIERVMRPAGRDPAGR